ncbi:WhiB family transcriptional regulator [Micromonospora lupini]|uniref:WhiB family transcriptional regulator n=1 Tax=Micromonospora lupini TaxID=285679 RepID=UPI00338E3376
MREIVPACDSVDPALFFPGPGQRPDGAKAACRGCPLLEDCRAWALSRPKYQLYGIWGGMTRQERINAAAAQPGRTTIR